TVQAGQDGLGQEWRNTHHATATFGEDTPCEIVSPLSQAPPALDILDPRLALRGSMAPHLAQHVVYRLDGSPQIRGGNTVRPAVERLWMRCRDGAPLDTTRMAYLLDALYPPCWTLFKRPAAMATVDLRYDFITDPTPQNTPDGWAFFEFRMLDFGGGWTVDEA